MIPVVNHSPAAAEKIQADETSDARNILTGDSNVLSIGVADTDFTNKNGRHPNRTIGSCNSDHAALSFQIVSEKMCHVEISEEESYTFWKDLAIESNIDAV